MTALTDVRRMAKALSAGNERDEEILLSYYGAVEPDFQPVSQVELASSFGITRQAVNARIKRLMARVQDSHLTLLTLQPDVRQQIASGAKVGRSVLGALPLKGAAAFYRGVARDPGAMEPTGRIPAVQFDALAQAAYGVRRKARTAAARLLLVEGMPLDKAAAQSGISARQIARDARDLLELHAQAIDAYRGSSPQHPIKSTEPHHE